MLKGSTQEQDKYKQLLWYHSFPARPQSFSCRVLAGPRLYMSPARLLGAGRGTNGGVIGICSWYRLWCGTPEIESLNEISGL